MELLKNVALTTLLVVCLHAAQGQSLYELNQTLRKQSSLESCLQYLDQVQSLAHEQDSLGRLAEAHFIIGYKYRLKSQFVSAFDHYRIAKDLYKQSSDYTQLEKVLENMAKIYVLLYDYEKAGFFYNQALEVNEQLGDKYQIALSHKDIAYTYRERDAFDKALLHYKEALDLLISLDKMGNAANIRIDIGIINFELGRYEDAVSHYFAALEMDPNSNVREAKVYNNAANAYYHEGKKEKAYHYIEKAIQIKRELENNNWLVSSLNNLGKFHFSDKDYAKATDVLSEAYRINQLSELKGARAKELYTSLTYLDSIAIMTNNPDLIAELNIGDKHTRLAINSMNQLVQLEHEYNNALAESINQKVEQEAKERIDRIFYWRVGIVLLIIMMAVAFWARKKYKERKKLKESIDQSVSLLQSVRSKMRELS